MRKAYYILSVQLLLFILLLFSRCTLTKEEDAWIAKVDSEKISKRMFMLFVNRHRSDMSNIFLKYNTKDKNQKKDSHETSINKNSSDYIKKKSLDDCVEVFAQQLIARKKGVVKDISYKSFLESFNKLNEGRVSTIGNKKIVYGPLTYSEDSYFNHLFDSMVYELKNKLVGNEIIVNEKYLLNYYEDRKEPLFVKEKSERGTIYWSYNEIKQTVLTSYIDSEYEKYVDAEISKMNIEVNDDVLNQIIIE